MNNAPLLPELGDYLPMAAVQHFGPMSACLVKSPQSGRVQWAEWIDAGETSQTLFASVRRHWQSNVQRQPAGSLKQHAFRDTGQRLLRVIDTPRGSPLKDWIFTRQFDLDEVLQTAISLTTCVTDWHQMSRVQLWLGSESIFRDSRNRIELRDAPVFDVHTEHDCLVLPVRDIAFLSPESSGSLAREISPASDMYSIGALLFSMLAGRPPIDATNASDYLDRQLCDEPPRLRELGLSIPQALDDMVARLLRRDPRDRYETATALLYDLQCIARSGAAPRAQAPFAIGTCDIRSTLTEATLVGREEEIDAVQRAINDARSGVSRLQLIVGSEASCRRSLLDEVALRAVSHEMHVFRGRATTSTNAKPLQSLEGVLSAIVKLCDEQQDLADRIAQATSEHAGTLSELEPALARLWSHSAGPIGPGAYGSQRAAIALEELLAAFAKESRGVAFLFDDLELADDLTRIVVRSLAHRIKHGRGSFLLCVITAESPQTLNHLLTCPPIQLGPISDAALELHLQSTAGKLSEPIRRSIIEVAGGNAMMASAILGRMIDTGAISPSKQGWISNGSLMDALRGDESIAELLERQIDALSPAALRTLSTAAVLGQSFNLELLAHVTGTRYIEVLEITTDALARRLLWRDSRAGRFRFAHDQIHQQLYGVLDSSDRQQLHLKTAAYLETHDPDNVFDLAFHYDAAGEGDLALAKSLQAARAARQRVSLSVAQEQLEIASRWVAADDHLRGLEISEGLGEIHLLAGRYDQAAACLNQALGLAQSAFEKARVQQQIGELAFKRGRFADAAMQYEQALAIAGLRVPANTLTMLSGLLAQSFCQLTHTYLPASWIARKGDPTALDCLRLQLLSQLSRVYWFSRHKLWTLGNHLRSLNEAERFAPSATLAAIYSEHGPVMSLLRWFSRANRYAERSLAIRRQHDDRWGQGQSHHYHSVVMLAECRFPDAIDTAMNAVEMLRQTGDFWEMNMARYQAANAMYRAGRLIEAAQTAAQMFYSGREIGDSQATGISLDVWARASPQTLPLEVVAAEATRARPDAQSHAQTQLAYAICLLHHNRIDEAIITLQDAIDRCRAAGHLNTYISPCYAWLGTALRRRFEATASREVRLLQDRFRDAQRMVCKASRIARGFPADQAHCLREMALLQSMLGNVRRAKRFLSKSLSSAEQYAQPIEELDSLKALQSLYSREATLLGPFPVASQSRLAELTELHESPLQRDVSGEPQAVNLSLADRFVTVLQSGRRIAQALSASAVYAEASESARRLLRGQHVDVVTIRHELDELRFEPWSGTGVDDLRQRRTEAHAELIQAAMHRSQAVCQRDIGNDARSARGSAIAAPIAFRGKCVAVIVVTHDQLKDLFGDDELRIADFICTLAGAALENADGFLSLQQMNETLEQRVLERTQAAEERARQIARSNEQLRETQEQLREAIVHANTANEAKGRFLATISHEIRTPLNGILGMTRLAQQASGQQPQSGYLDVVQESGQSLLTLINDLLDFSKLEAGKMELERIELDPRQLAGEVTRLMAASAWQKGVEMVCDVDPGVPETIQGDPSRLRQVIMNLLGNAIKFTQRGYIALLIRTTSTDGSPAQLSIEVQDSGIGIPLDKQKKVFESFSQADSSTTRQYGGTGLGLAICQEIVEMMGGSILLRSEVGVGSTFTVMLPLETHSGPIQQRRFAVGRRVAVIDPLLVSRRSIVEALSCTGATVTAIADVNTISEAFFDSPWDLVIFGCSETERVANRCSTLDIACLFLSPAHADSQVGRGQWSAVLRKPAISTDIVAAAEGLMLRDPRWRFSTAIELDVARQPLVASGTSPQSFDAPPQPTGGWSQADSTAELIHRNASPADDAAAATVARILVAEDGVINQEVIVGILQLQGHEVVVANDGEEALRQATSGGFDLCLMDVDMPKMDGIEATRQIRAQMQSAGSTHLPIIAMTAHCGDHIWESCKTAGMDAYLPKPIQPASLFQTIEQFMVRQLPTAVQGAGEATGGCGAATCAELPR